MSSFDYFQILVDLVLFFFILVFVLGRGWKRGAVAEEQGSYREMISTLSTLIREMKAESAELQDRISEKELEVARAVALADEKIRRLKEAEAAPPSVAVAAPARAAPPPVSLESPGENPDAVVREALLRAPAAGEGPAPTATVTARPPAGEMDDEERREKYRQALDFAQKGWSSLDIARFTGLPRGEVELLMRTKGKQV